MKKIVFVASLVFAVTVASAQSAGKDDAPKPPPPPKPPVAKVREAPPPPPPPSEVSPPDEPPPPPPPLNAQVPEDFAAFLKKNPAVKNVQWKNDEVIIGLKSGKEERYNLNDEASKKAAEAKYGTLPQAPPPPPPPPTPPRPPKKKTTLS